jgi:hypothetical protein
MKKLLFAVPLITFFSCNHHNEKIVNPVFIDSLINNYTEPASVKNNAAEILFWKGRINPVIPGLVNESKYAANLISRFQLKGDIKDVKTADSILKKTDSLFNHKEASPSLSMVRHCILQHRFKEASNYLQSAIAIGIKPYETYSSLFDVNFELGNYSLATQSLKAIRAANDYGYKFRQSKWEHYNGNFDSAVAAMQKAILLSGDNVSLKQAALSNTADLNLHNGNLQEANDLYIKSIRLDAGDLHSIMGLGWIALVHDKKDTLAEKIFRFVQTKTKAPDALFRLVSVAQARENNTEEKKLAEEFVKYAGDSLYGNMYNKYLIELYTDVLNDPAKAESIAKKELEGRATPQTYSWYAYCLFKNNKEEEALIVYNKHVSGKPLESLELYWIGKMLKGMHKGYDAKGYLSAAYSNRFDLCPAKIKDMELMKDIK